MKRVLTVDEKEDVLEMYKSGYPIRAIAAEHDLSLSAVSTIAKMNGLQRQKHKPRSSVDCDGCRTRNPATANYCMGCGQKL